MAITVATDFSASSAAAVSFAQRLALIRGEELHLIHVVEGIGDEGWRMLYETPMEIEEHVRNRASEELHAFASKLVDVPDANYHIRFGHVVDQILAAAADAGSELIVLGTSGKSEWKAAAFGTTTSRVITRAAVPVLSVPESVSGAAVQRVAVAVDLGEGSEQVMALGGQMARDLGAEVVAIHALELPRFSELYAPPLSFDAPAIEQHLANHRDRLQGVVEAAGVTDICGKLDVRVSRPDLAIEDAIEEDGVQLVVMGTHGRTGLDRLLLGSTAERVLRDTTLPVLTVRPVEALE